MLVRLSLALMLVLVAAGAWFWLKQPAPPSPAREAKGDVAALRQTAIGLFEQGKERRRDPARSRATFSQAADAFAQLARVEPSAETYLNLGKACLLARRLPEAVLAFHHGLRHDPDDNRLRAHLEYARAMVAYGPGERGKPAEEHWPDWLPRTKSLLTWGILATYTLAFVFLTLALTRQRWRTLVWAGLLACCTLVQLWLWRCGQDERPLIVVTGETALRQGNGASYPTHPDLAYLAGGMEARAIAQRGGWLLIEMPTGEIGWVERVAVTESCTRAFRP